MPTANDLDRILTRIDGRGYKAYKELRGGYDFEDFSLYIDHVQGDPFAAPSKIRLRVPQSVAELPEELFRSRVRRIALEDFLARQVKEAILESVRGHRGTGKSGRVTIDAGRQEVLERTAVVVAKEWVEARVEVGLPAAGRRILGREAEAILCHELPRVAELGLRWENLHHEKAQEFVECVENQEHIRSRLEGLGLVAVVGEGAILPRSSGVDDRPLGEDRAVAFRSPESLRVSVDLPNPIPGPNGPSRSLVGMGIPKGVTLIVGGGYHGKSTLLRALERCVYPHVPGDGREYVVSNHSLVKIRAEDGRRIEKVDISPFIARLPLGQNTTKFSTDDASGSTSQAASILEALEVGASGLLLDEDTSATNFMVRDARMQELVPKDHEPITPFLDRVRELYESLGISTVLVMGGCGDYFEVADTVIMMREYLPLEVTAEAKRVAAGHATHRRREVTSVLTQPAGRVPLAESFDPSRGRRQIKIDAKAVDSILFGTSQIDLRAVEQLLDLGQTNAVGQAIRLAAQRWMDGDKALPEIVDSLEEFFEDAGLDALDPYHHAGEHPGNFARPRKFEIAAAINRLRTVQMNSSV